MAWNRVVDRNNPELLNGPGTVGDVRWVRRGVRVVRERRPDLSFVYVVQYTRDGSPVYEEYRTEELALRRATNLIRGGGA